MLSVRSATRRVRHSRVRRTLVPTGVAAFIGLAGCGPQTAPPDFDLVVRGATVVDGTGMPGFQADVAVSGGRIASIGDLDGLRGGEEIDGEGLVVAPGFINLHSHAYLDGLSTAANMLSQGVTTEVINADGGSPLDLGAQLAEARAGGLAINVAANIGFNSVWTSVMGREDRRATTSEIRSMAEAVEAGLQQGAWGVSAGLDYKPAYFATTDEVVSILSDAGRWRTVFTNHDRITPESGFSSMVGMRETVEIGERTGLMPLITHMKVQGREQGSIDDVLEMMDEAAARGVPVAADAYPYLAGQTSLAALIIPAWAQEGGADAMMSRFVDPTQRQRIIAEANEAIDARFGGARGVFLPERRRELTAFMDSLGSSSAGEAVVDILASESPSAILRFGAEADLRGILRYPTTSVACDCDASAEGASHPRGYGTFPRVLGRYVREEGVLTLEEAVRKMSGLPATTIGMVDRGFIAVGMAADLVVFDPRTIIDHATYENPTAESEGVRHVLVNGVVAVRDGVVTGTQGGQALERAHVLPARTMSFDADRSVSFEGVLLGADSSAVPGGRVRIDVTQGEGERQARGVLNITGRGSDDIEAVEFGLLQTGPGWASISARVMVGDGSERALTVVVDARSPAGGDFDALVLIDLEGEAARIVPVDGALATNPGGAS